MRQTSLFSFNELKQNNKLGNLQQLVYNWFSQFPNSTDREISQMSEIEINILVPRRNELVKMGHLVMFNKRECYITGKKAMTWTTKKLWNKEIKRFK